MLSIWERFMGSQVSCGASPRPLVFLAGKWAVWGERGALGVEARQKG